LIIGNNYRQIAYSSADTLVALCNAKGRLENHVQRT